ncbi:MAG TPA: DUF1801 domain-containing protein [Caulobacteraceae bacterium]|nr:DUF1801 domain-containing protein [Caulobacteraceae bacterium]
MIDKPGTIDEYLSRLSEDKRAALQALREMIRAAAPQAEECISYQMPAFRLNGMLVGFAAARRHCALYAWNGSTVGLFADELKGYDTSKGAIRFTPDKPLPETLVRRLVEMKVAKNAEKSAAVKSRTGR